MTAPRFYLDEHLSPAIAAAMVRAGLDCVTSDQVGRRGARDEDNLLWCRATERVIVTHDDDYLVLASQGMEHSGIAFCRLGKYSRRGLIAALLAIVDDTAGESMGGRIFFL